ncbi:basic salivary proline-rich protein 2-like [Vidua chalybeata]|uniref:basic salivary proline-rich protein 2-like n=1 Tax=Vidua chalybeata TaxID=81927 RepID=UPI0023A7B103|nr:basic salivary proline-rich protein 2-like [Vidua chalybeata]
MEVTMGTLAVALGTLLLLGGPAAPLPVPEPWGQAVTSLLQSLLPAGTARGHEGTARGHEGTARPQGLGTWLQGLGTWLQRHPGRPQEPRGPWGHPRAPAGAWGRPQGAGTCPQEEGTAGTRPQGQGTAGTGPQGPLPPVPGQATRPQEEGTRPQWPLPPPPAQGTGPQGEGTGPQGEGTRPQGHPPRQEWPGVAPLGDIGSRDTSRDSEDSASRGWGHSEELREPL